MNKMKLLLELAKAYNNLDYSLLHSIVSDDIVYESQDVFSALVGREKVFKYLEAKFLTVRNSALPVYAEMSFLDNEPSAGIYAKTKENHPCIILSQGTKENKIALVLVKVSESRIRRIDVCTVFPHFSEAAPTGFYPS
jgi:hypothetical protein